MGEEVYYYRCKGYNGLIRPHPYKSLIRLPEDARELCKECRTFYLEDLIEDRIREKNIINK